MKQKPKNIKKIQKPKNIKKNKPKIKKNKKTAKNPKKYHMEQNIEYRL